MDLGAYAKIKDLGQIMIDNGIEIPRLRGLRLMSEEKPLSEEEINDEIKFVGLKKCKDLCQSDFHLNANWFELSSRTDRIKKKYIIYDKDENETGVNWKNLHGRKRKLFRYCLKSAKKRVLQTYRSFNRYCGQENVLYIHARIGGKNWGYFGGPLIARQPWFIEKADDAFDSTYCDIYARLEKK
ncbi:MAG: hypothetical protein IJI57_13900 [Flexilinea sp.]|nr:hypothetical protein [Flexilinea sp.]